MSFPPLEHFQLNVPMVGSGDKPRPGRDAAKKFPLNPSHCQEF
jgi:hypothetical protein